MLVTVLWSKGESLSLGHAHWVSNSSQLTANRCHRTANQTMIQIKQTVSEQQEVSYALLIGTQRATHLIYS